MNKLHHFQDLRYQMNQGYLEMYLPEKQINIKSPAFCQKYKIEWDSHGIQNTSDTTDHGCYVNQNSTSTNFNDPWSGPGLFNNNRTDVTQYDWLLQRILLSLILGMNKEMFLVYNNQLLKLSI